MTGTLTEISENTKMARETALFGQYDTSLVYYQGVIQQIQKYLSSIEDPDRRRKWMQVLELNVIQNVWNLLYLSFISSFPSPRLYSVNEDFTFVSDAMCVLLIMKVFNDFSFKIVNQIDESIYIYDVPQ